MLLLLLLFAGNQVHLYAKTRRSGASDADGGTQLLIKGRVLLVTKSPRVVRAENAKGPP